MSIDEEKMERFEGRHWYSSEETQKMADVRLRERNGCYNRYVTRSQATRKKKKQENDIVEI